MDAIQALRLKLEGNASAYALLGERDLPALLREAAAALTPPDGYVLVPVDPTQQMLDAGWDADEAVADVPTTWAAMLAARPEVEG